jgi:hypothetical protein
MSFAGIFLIHAVLMCMVSPLLHLRDLQILRKRKLQKQQEQDKGDSNGNSDHAPTSWGGVEGALALSGQSERKIGWGMGEGEVPNKGKAPY